MEPSNRLNQPLSLQLFVSVLILHPSSVHFRYLGWAQSGGLIQTQDTLVFFSQLRRTNIATKNYISVKSIDTIIKLGAT